MPPKLKQNLPPVPRGQDADTTRWMQALAQMVKAGMDGSGVTVQDLIDAGLAKSDGHGGFLPSTPKPNLTVPPKMTGLKANGAFALIILNWDEVSYANYSHVEVWRADVNDIGQATLVGTTVSMVYSDSIGTAADKWYWVRSVTTSNVAGEFSDPAEGKTSLDPKYVMKMLTSVKWKPNTVYEPFQYVQPTAGGDFVYVCITGGTSWAIEPTWGIVVGGTTYDNGVIWKCQNKSDSVPFGIGMVDGKESVVINQLYVEDASITNAKIGQLSADKISTGFLAVDRIANSSITSNKINVNQLSAISANIGYFETDAPDGSRMTIQGDLIQIFDSSGALRIRMGIWS